MLNSKDLSVYTPDGKKILSSVSCRFSNKSMNAVVGPSGCGKTTLMKAMLGMIPKEGESFFNGNIIETCEDLAGDVGFVPQFTLAQLNLTVEETLLYALNLTLKDKSEHKQRLSSILETIQLLEHKNKRVGALSGGQMRRLGLGLELVLNPSYLVCDEVTSGLDPNSENMLLGLLRQLVEKEDKTIVCIIHNLTKLSLFDTITVLYQGELVFQGNYESFLYYFQISDPLCLYSRLEENTPSFWTNAWKEAIGATEKSDEEKEETSATKIEKLSKSKESVSLFTQLVTLLSRRFKLFFRDTGYLALTLAITFGFPCIVVIFALSGIPQVEQIPLDQSATISMQAFQNAMQIQVQNSQVASLATGLILFQVILLTLMGANNGGREIAAERTLYEKERMNGLRPSSYALSKILFTSIIAILQGAWMCLFVKTICIFPGDWMSQMFTMIAVCVSMTLVCLGFSALMQSAEKASLLSIYLVGFQLPLAGIVLGLPDALVWVFRPLILTFWGWSGYFSSMSGADIFDAYTLINPNATICDVPISLGVLAGHAILGIFLIFIGCLKKRPL